MGIDAQMLIRTREPVSPEQVLKTAYKMCSAFWTDSFWISRDSVPMRHALAIVDEYLQDGDSIFPEDGETLIEVYLFGRYYGKGYERGDLPFYIQVAEFLEYHIPGAKVYYGGDSSGVLAYPFGKQERAELWQHFLEVGHMPYVNEGWFNREPDKKPICDLCREPMVQNMAGANRRGYICTGCNYSLRTDDGGTTFYEHKEPK